MGKATNFEWLGDSCVARRSKRRLKRGQIYDVTEFGEAVVDEWVRTKFAKYIQTAAKKSEKGND